MKKLNDFIQNNYISLEGIDETLVKSISNLNDKQILECCGCGCCDSELKCCDPYYGRPQYSESEITSILRNEPTVQNLWDIHYQFSNRYRFPGESLEETEEPLYFRTNIMTIQNNYTSGEPQTTTLMGTDALRNEKLYNFIKSLVKDFKLVYPTVLETEGKLQLFFIKGEGGVDQSDKNIKQGLENVAKLLGKLESKDEITWSQVLNVGIMNTSNIYNFLVTCTIDISKFLMTSEDYKKLQNKLKKEDK
jgi:hypothetical protein